MVHGILYSPFQQGALSLWKTMLPVPCCCGRSSICSTKIHCSTKELSWVLLRQITCQRISCNIHNCSRCITAINSVSLKSNVLSILIEFIPCYMTFSVPSSVKYLGLIKLHPLALINKCLMLHWSSDQHFFCRRPSRHTCRCI